HDDPLLGLVDDERRVEANEGSERDARQGQRVVLHGFCSGFWRDWVCGRGGGCASRRLSSGSGGTWPSCTTSTEPTRGSAWLSVSRYSRDRVTSGTRRYSASTASKRAVSPSARFTRSVA